MWMSSCRRRQPRVSVLSVLTGALAAVLVLTGLGAPGGVVSATADVSATPAAARTWIIDAVDDEQGARWVSRDTGTSEVTILVGDTVEWRFEFPRAGQEHDLTSQDTSSTWDEPVQQARAPGGPPISRTFTRAGTYDFYCSIHGPTMSGTVVVGEGDATPPPTDPEPPTVGHSSHLPGASATATPASGAAPLNVAFSAEVTTGGPVRPFAAGSTSHPGLAGDASLVRRRAQTYASLEVSGLRPNSHHIVHVHEQACASNSGGAHFRFDTSQPFAEANELWLPFTTDSSGSSGRVEVTRPQRAGPDAVSMVIHDPDNHALRIGCVDLAPGTADLTYSWDFGDGTTGRGADPDHTYAAAGRYTATLTVANSHGARVLAAVAVSASDVAAPQTGLSGGPARQTRSQSASFRFTSTEPGSTFTCRLDATDWRACAADATFEGLTQGPHLLAVRATDAAGITDATPSSHAWVVDRTGPKIRRPRPSSTTTDVTPTVRATVVDALSSVRRLALRIDGDRVRPVRHDARRGRTSWTPRAPLTPGRHTVRLVAIDAAGNRTARSWQVRVVR
ncbi:PKD domain-containing protein [Nocardioides sp.]|uniref:PKD domain-containing protein n=1 Tax=Nocardioides sp. TaxID=35761 RepID=UPI002BF4D4EB|nr:PKD domain-containing protein [Nocardioides sp.]HXH79951.1 PKD domain-containing protein [Nocardioides sp.]